MGLQAAVLSDQWSWARAAPPRFSLKGMGIGIGTSGPLTSVIVSGGCASSAWMELIFLIFGILSWCWGREGVACIWRMKKGAHGAGALEAGCQHS